MPVSPSPVDCPCVDPQPLDLFASDPDFDKGGNLSAIVHESRPNAPIHVPPDVRRRYDDDARPLRASHSLFDPTHQPLQHAEEEAVELLEPLEWYHDDTPTKLDLDVATTLDMCSESRKIWARACGFHLVQKGADLMAGKLAFLCACKGRKAQL